MRKDNIPPALFEELKKKANRAGRTIYNRILNKVKEYNGTINRRTGSFLVAKDLDINFTKRNFLTSLIINKSITSFIT